MAYQDKLPSIVQVLVYNAYFITGDHNVITPELFYGAAGECIALLLATGWLITWIARPISPETGLVVWEGNALKNRIGYNNLCVGFDMHPALGFAMLAWVPISYLGLKYAVLDAYRTRLMQDQLSNFKVCFSLFTDLWYGTAFIGFMATFAVHPWDNVWGHTLGFLNLAIAQWFIYVANNIEGDHITTGSVCFGIFYGVVTVANFGLILSNYVYYEKTGHGPWEPWWIGCFFDYLWFLCLPMASSFMPAAEGIKTISKIVQPEEIGNKMEKYEASQNADGLITSIRSGLFGFGDDAEEEDEEAS